MRTVQSLHEKLVAGRGGVWGALLRPALRAASWGYGQALALRNRRYDRGAVTYAPVPVISVGNITTGGTGKTPMVIEVLTRLIRMERKPAVLSRGYKSTPTEQADELRLIARRVPEVVCVANPDRVEGLRQVLARGTVDTIVLDDGFQHRRLARDLDIVLVDATDAFGGGYLLPRGRLREPCANLRRADLLVLTRVDQAEPAALAALERQVDALSGGKPRIAAVHRPEPLRPLHAPESEPSGPGQGAVYLFSGIGRPAAFARTVQDLGLTVCGHTRFADHEHYTPAHVAKVCAAAQAAGAAAVLTTAKDAVKLERLSGGWTLPAWVLDVRIDFRGEGGTILDVALREAFQRRERHA